jgi:hypothetical protein
MKKKVLIPIWGWNDLKEGSIFQEGKVYRKVLKFIEEGGVKKAVVSYFVWVNEVDETPEAISARPELAKPCYKFELKGFTQFGSKRVTFVDEPN